MACSTYLQLEICNAKFANITVMLTKECHLNYAIVLSDIRNELPFNIKVEKRHAFNSLQQNYFCLADIILNS